jgi:hypothetical protein
VSRYQRPRGRGWETAVKYLTQLRPQLEWIGDMLGDGRPYLFGDNMSLADCVVYHALWIMDQLAYERVALIPPTVRLWMDRIAANGHGTFTPMTALEALNVAAAATPLPPLPSEVLEGDPTLGSEVSVTPTDTGRANSSSGTLAYIDATRVGLLHRNDNVGKVAIHLPRFAYRIRPLSN